jgi:hypothetical protein
VVIDQMRADYLQRWQALWGEGGFRRLLAESASFTNCHYPFACTETGPGHASLATGRLPGSHGIVGNFWYDRGTGQSPYCVEGTRPYQGVPSGAAGEGPSTPERLLGPTVGDALLASGRKSRVVSLAFKDRSAVLLGGQRPDACYWFDLWTGQFMTSTYYRDRLHPWVAELNRRRPADRWFGKDWTRLRPDLDYRPHSGPDDAVGEATGWLQGKTFPHPMTGGLKRLEGQEYANKDYYGTLSTSPFANELLLDLAKRAVDAERLGNGEASDLLCLSFSATDPIGHSWGPDSQEMLDTMLRMDQIVADLLNHLDTRVGRGRYLLVLTSDHGICPLPELARAQGKDAGRVLEPILGSGANGALQQAHAPGDKARWIEATAGYWLYLNRRLLRERGLKTEDVERTLVRWLKGQRGVLAAYSRTQLGAELPANDAIGQAVRRSFHPDRCGDVMVVLKPFYLLGPDLTGTSHGTPHAYDTHVPLLIYGPEVRGGTRTEPVSPLAVAVILARALGVDPPAGADGFVPADLLTGR